MVNRAGMPWQIMSYNPELSAPCRRKLHHRHCNYQGCTYAGQHSHD